MRLLCNLCPHIFSNFHQVLHRVDQPWAWMDVACPAHQADLEQDMDPLADLPADLLVTLPTALEAMADLLPQLRLAIQVFHHPHLACLLAHQAALRRTSSLLRPASTAHRQPSAVPQVSEGLPATLRHRGREKRREGINDNHVEYGRCSLSSLQDARTSTSASQGTRPVGIIAVRRNRGSHGL